MRLVGEAVIEIVFSKTTACFCCDQRLGAVSGQNAWLQGDKGLHKKIRPDLLAS